MESVFRPMPNIRIKVELMRLINFKTHKKSCSLLWTHFQNRVYVLKQVPGGTLQRYNVAKRTVHKDLLDY